MKIQNVYHECRFCGGNLLPRPIRIDDYDYLFQLNRETNTLVLAIYCEKCGRQGQIGYPILALLEYRRVD